MGEQHVTETQIHVCHEPQVALINDADDETEAFERMQQSQLTGLNPDRSAFFAAKKQVRRKQTAHAQRTNARAAGRA